jgi:hypothetical protein
MCAELPDLTIVRLWFSDANFEPILKVAENKKGILSQLTALTLVVLKYCLWILYQLPTFPLLCWLAVSFKIGWSTCCPKS